MSLAPARWWHPLGPGRIQCELCPHHCVLTEGGRGRCGVRQDRAGALWTEVHGVTSGLAVDPIEKKPLYHFLPGSQVLSFGTRGCNLSCDFCQNAALSDPQAGAPLHPATPEALADLTLRQGCASLAFTYNEPIISAEFCLEVAAACRARGLRTVAVTNGFVGGAAREEFFATMDAANVDLKSFREAFYREHCGTRLGPILETLEHLARHTGTWLEVTTLLIPGLNDGDPELEEMVAWFATHLGPDVPWHFSAFRPAHRRLDRPPTPTATLARARAAAQAAGIRYVYLGNSSDPDGGTTTCPQCGNLLFRREGFRVLRQAVGGRCRCGAILPGVFEAVP